MKKTRKLFPEDEKLQREIARRLKAGVPLAGLISAALLCGGCGGELSPHVVGIEERPPETRTPPPPENRGCEQKDPGAVRGRRSACSEEARKDPDAPPKPENRGNERKDTRFITGESPAAPAKK